MEERKMSKQSLRVLDENSTDMMRLAKELGGLVEEYPPVSFVVIGYGGGRKVTDLVCVGFSFFVSSLKM